MISAIVLAAGLARRFGSAKPLAKHKGKALVRHVVDAVSVPEVSDVLVVAPAPATGFADALAGSRARVVINEHSDAGMSRSLLAGLDALDAATEAVIIALADEPTIARSVVESLVREWRTAKAEIVAPVYRGERGHPVLFNASVFPELKLLAGDRGARAIIESDPGRVRLVPVDADMPKDVDTREDLAGL
ncbi:MAG TPA: nucleotidyltransferase family protein [Gemmatimonadaceae bacterium]